MKGGMIACAMKQQTRLVELAQLFLKLGIIGFGGPAAHVAMMEDEVVRKRDWLTRDQFMDLLGAVNLIPGPNSTEMAIHIGLLRAGAWGAVIAGSCFILPAFLIVLALAMGYASYGTTPQANAFLYGLKPVIVAIIAVATIRFGQTSLKTKTLFTLGALAFAFGVWGTVDQLIILIGAGLAMLIVSRATLDKGTVLLVGVPSTLLQITNAVTLPQIAVVFLRIGATLFGSGYLLVAYLEQEVVINNRWLTPQQLFDAIAVGQFTPGPVLTTATFVGYLIQGMQGAVVATVAIFFPSFIFVIASGFFINRLRNSPAASAFIKGVNAAVVGLIGATLISLGRAAMIDPITIIVCLAAFIVLLRFKIDSTWLIAAGGMIGLLLGGTS
ncbi:MAG: chromate efflux transporter [Chloroflexi bacterium]|nr:chromate efflux transporter [Chloroflexota bacterium]